MAASGQPENAGETEFQGRVLNFDRQCDLGKLLGLSEPQLPDLWNEDNTYFCGQHVKKARRACENVEDRLICKLYKGWWWWWFYYYHSHHWRNFPIALGRNKGKHKFSGLEMAKESLCHISHSLPGTTPKQDVAFPWWGRWCLAKFPCLSGPGGVRMVEGLMPEGNWATICQLPFWGFCQVVWDSIIMKTLGGSRNGSDINLALSNLQGLIIPSINGHLLCCSVSGTLLVFMIPWWTRQILSLPSWKLHSKWLWMDLKTSTNFLKLAMKLHVLVHPPLSLGMCLHLW